ncbi:MAG: hypothetical protein KAJ43_11350 [Gemmatimonadetes bacterium]|nr:hypothetical protein [Gemmatimonadota bacterium]
MPLVRVKADIDQKVWEDFRSYALESGLSTSDLLTVALREFLARRRARPVVMSELEASMRQNRRLGESLAQ